MATHYEAQQALCYYSPLCRLTVYREKAEEVRPIEKEGKTLNLVCFSFELIFYFHFLHVT